MTVIPFPRPEVAAEPLREVERRPDYARYGADREHLVAELETATRAGDRGAAEQVLEHLRVLSDELRREERNAPELEEPEEMTR